MKPFLRKLLTICIVSAVFVTLCSCGEKYEPSKEVPEKSVTNTETVSGYESKKFNLKFTPPEGYVMFTDSQKAAQMAGAKNVSCEMISEHSDGFPQVKVVVEKFDGDETQYLQSKHETFDVNNISATYSEISEKEIAGERYLSFVICAEDTINMEFYAKKYDDGMLCISVTSLVGSDAKSPLDAFSKVE